MAATIKVVDLLADAQIILLDTTGTRWSLSELQRWLNAAYREVVTFRPDASTQIGTYTCQAGVRQQLDTVFSNAVRLIEVVRNVAATSSKAVVSLVDKKSLDDHRPGWPNEASAVTVENYIYDPRTPLSFLVYPPATTAAQVEVIYESVPSPHTLTDVQLQNSSTSEVIRLTDAYANPLLDYVLYRAFAKDSDNPTLAARSAGHYQSFLTALKVKTEADVITAPGAG